MSDESKQPNTLVRDLDLTEAMAIGLGAMGGAGIFVLAAFALGQTGPGAILSFILAGLVCLPITLVISELATGMPQAGGSYSFISRALGASAGAVVGPGNWLGLTFAGSFFLIALGKYLAEILHLPPWPTTLVVGLAFTYLNYRGTKASGRLQNVVVFAFLSILALFVLLGLFQVKAELYRPFFPFGVRQAVVTVGLIIVSYTGFEKISTLAEEIKDPARNLPLAVITVVLIAIILYAAVLFVTAGLLPIAVIKQSKTPLVDAAGQVAGQWGQWAMLAAGLLATASSANAAIIASSRINFAMGRDRILPGWLEAIHPGKMTPYRSVLVTGGIATALALSGQAETLAEVSSALFMLNYILLCVSAIVMRRSRPSWYRPAFHIPLYPLPPIMGVVLCAAVILVMAPLSQAASAGLVVLSLLWYIAWGQKHARVRGEMGPLIERERPLEQVASAVARVAEAQRHEVLVPVANPATTKGLITLAAALAHGRPGTEVAALKVVPVPVALPLSAVQEYLDRQTPSEEDTLRRAAKHGAVADIRIQMLLRAAHGIASGIVAVAESRPETRLILLGWRGPLAIDRVRNSVDKEVVRTAPHDVAVFLNRDLNEVRRILIPAGGGPHARLGLRLVHDLVKGADARLVVLRVVRRKDADMNVERLAVEKLIQNELGSVDGRVSAQVVQSADIAKRILLEARKGYDLLVIGASEEWTLRNWLFGAIPDEVAAHAPCSVLMVKKYEPSPISWLRRTASRFPRL